jgi:CheY-like chemotaxis protein
VSHGIEEPEIRKNKKKDEKGNIKIVATGQGSRIKIVVEDDGAGIDFEKVVKKAISLNLITEDSAKTLSKKEILNFIFTTNFSTADQIDTLSGRGVGLDIVKDKIESIGGAIFVDTSEKGTVFTFEVPVSLSILNCIVISTSGKKIAIPINLIKKIVKIKEDMIINDGNTEKLIYEDIPYSFVRLSQLSGEDVDSEKMGALTANDNICIIFEQFVGEKLFSVKGLSGIIGRIPQVIGFSIDDNFDPIAIINPVKIKIDKQPTTNTFTKTPKEKRSALVADDNNLIREMIAEFLNSMGIEVTAAKDGKEALNLFKNRKFDIVITDIEMPEMDGISFLKEIRKIDNVIPVLILSSRGEPQDIALGLHNGANGYFVKKFFSKDGFLKKVQSLL